MQRGVERPLLGLQLIGVEFDGFGDGVAVRRSTRQRAENQQVQRSLQQLDALAFFFSRRSRREK